MREGEESESEWVSLYGSHLLHFLNLLMREGEERERIWFGLVPRFTQRLELGQIKARNQECNTGFLHGWQEYHLSHHWCSQNVQETGSHELELGMEPMKLLYERLGNSAGRLNPCSSLNIFKCLEYSYGNFYFLMLLSTVICVIAGFVALDCLSAHYELHFPALHDWLILIRWQTLWILPCW